MTTYKQRRAKRRGDDGEDIATMQMNALGFRMIRTVHNGWRIVKWLPHIGKNIARIVPVEKLEGDRRAITPNGRSVLAEVKSYDDKLPHSAVKEHQREALLEHASNKGLSLLVWVDRGNCYVMRWPVPGFVYGTSLKPAQAEEAMNKLMFDMRTGRF